MEFNEFRPTNSSDDLCLLFYLFLLLWFDPSRVQPKSDRWLSPSNTVDLKELYSQKVIDKSAHWFITVPVFMWRFWSFLGQCTYCTYFLDSVLYVGKGSQQDLICCMKEDNYKKFNFLINRKHFPLIYFKCVFKSEFSKEPCTNFKTEILNMAAFFCTASPYAKRRQTLRYILVH